MVKQVKNSGIHKIKKVIPASQKTVQQIPEKKFYDKPGFLFIIIIVITTLAFIPSLKNDFMDTWDDSIYVTNNPLITGCNLYAMKEMFITPVNGTYVPIPLLTFAAEYKLFGHNPLPFHITNLILHLLCTLLIFQFLRQLKLNILFAAFGALLAGVHPMRVESVAWITERKDLLYSLFYLASMIAYILYLKAEKRPVRYLILSMFLFALSLFSKIQAVTLPLSLLLIDYYFERPLKLQLILEKVPYIILSLFFGIVGIYILHKEGVLKPSEFMSFGDRLLYGFFTLSTYIFRFFAPFNLSAIHPYPVSVGNPLPVFYYLNPLIIFFLGFLVYRSFHKTRAIIFGSLFFLFNVFFHAANSGGRQCFFSRPLYLHPLYWVFLHCRMGL